MNRLAKRLAALALAGTMMVSASLTAFAAGSPVAGNVGNDTSVAGTTTSDTGVKVENVTSDTDTAYVPSSVTLGGKTYSVDRIATSTLKQKTMKKVTLAVTSNTKFSKKVVKVKSAKKLKRVVVTSTSGKLKATNFAKTAFKGYKGKLIVKKNAMTKAQYKKLVKRLRKGGFKGKIYYKK